MRSLFIAMCLILITSAAQAFCGFYVAKSDGELINQASKVVYVRDGRNSVITMSSDYRGAPRDFAMIVPTPRVLKRDQIRTPKAATVQHLVDYTAPRLVEYFDRDPCANGGVVIDAPVIVEEAVERCLFCNRSARDKKARTLGVKIRAEYAVNNYDVLILDAKQSDGLVTFLTSEGYKLPDGAEKALAGYIKNKMKFFVAKVNLDRHAASRTKELPPLQIAFRSRDFMLPIQLGKLNADKAQDALFLMLTREGRVEVSNYRVTEFPSNVNVPVFVEQVASQFFEAVTNKVFDRHTIALEYAWDMAWCDPCAADPLTNKELAELGVTWLKSGSRAGQDVYVTRFHAQYTKRQMPKDLAFKVTNNRANFQGRYIMNKPFTGDVSCEAGQAYVDQKRRSLREEAVDLARITGWRPRNIEDNIRKTVPSVYW